MRKVLVQELMTLDGFVAGPNDELDFFESAGDFSEVDRANLKQLEGVDSVLLGAATYRMFVDYWPTPQSEGEIVAEMVNTIPKVVFSSTLDRAPWGSSPEARLVRGNAVDEVTSLKQGPGKDIIVWGSLTLAQSLLGAGLIDEVQLHVCPITLGEGRRLFTGDAARLNLQVLEAKTYDVGDVVTLRYRPERAT
jgi:dihydrofolate reductase